MGPIWTVSTLVKNNRSYRHYHLFPNRTYFIEGALIGPVSVLDILRKHDWGSMYRQKCFKQASFCRFFFASHFKKALVTAQNDNPHSPFVIVRQLAYNFILKMGHYLLIVHLISEGCHALFDISTVNPLVFL